MASSSGDIERRLDESWRAAQNAMEATNSGWQGVKAAQFRASYWMGLEQGTVNFRDELRSFLSTIEQLRREINYP